MAMLEEAQEDPYDWGVAGKVTDEREGRNAPPEISIFLYNVNWTFAIPSGWLSFWFFRCWSFLRIWGFPYRHTAFQSIIHIILPITVVAQWPIYVSWRSCRFWSIYGIILLPFPGWLWVWHFSFIDDRWRHRRHIDGVLLQAVDAGSAGWNQWNDLAGRNEASSKRAQKRGQWYHFEDWVMEEYRIRRVFPTNLYSTNSL